MKRVLQIALLCVLIVVVIISALPLILSTETMRERIIAHVSNITPGKVSFQQSPSISFNPFLGIEISDFKIQDPLSGDTQSNLLNAEKVKAKLDILPALLGRINISEYQLVRPKLNLKVYSDGKSNWTSQDTKLGEIFKSFTQAQQEENSDTTEVARLSFGRFDIIDGLIEYEDTIADKQYKITGVDGSFNWPTTDSAASFSGVAIWRNEIIKSQLNLEEPLKFITGSESDVSLTLESNPVTLGFDGKANTLSDLFVSGALEWQTPSLTRITEFLELDLGNYANLGSIIANGNIEATADTLTLTDANISINENNAKGVIIITNNELGNIALDGTLAFEQINTADYFNISLVDGAESTEEKIENNFSADLRLSAQSFVSGALELEQVAASISTRGNEWTFDISDASIFDGNIIAKLGERKIGDKFQNFIDINARNINTSELLELFPENKVSLSGTSTFEAKLTTNYRIEADLINRLNGTVNLEVTDGSISGLDILSLMQAPPTLANKQHTINDGDVTSFSNIKSAFTLQNGLAYISNTAIQQEENTIRLTGSMNLSNDAWVVRATSDQKDTRSIIMGGTIKAPLILYSQENAQDVLPEIQSEEQNNDVSN